MTDAADFGPMAPGQARRDSDSDSDIDIMMAFDKDRQMNIFDDAGVKAYRADRFEASVDVMDRNAIKPGLLRRVAMVRIQATRFIYLFLCGILKNAALKHCVGAVIPLSSSR